MQTCKNDLFLGIFVEKLFSTEAEFLDRKRPQLPINLIVSGIQNPRQNKDRKRPQSYLNPISAGIDSQCTYLKSEDTREPEFQFSGRAGSC